MDRPGTERRSGESVAHQTDPGDDEAEAAATAAQNLKIGQPKAPRLIAIRGARPEHVEDFRPIAEEFHAESRYGHIPFSHQKFEKLFLRGIKNPETHLAVQICHGDKVIGLLQASVGDYYLGEGFPMVTVQTFYVSKSVRQSALGGRAVLKMMRILTDWARSKNAQELHMHATSGIAPERTDRLLRRLGFRVYGGCCVCKP